MGKISEIFNFENIGGKIKDLAKWSCWITILLIWIAAPIAFIVLVSDKWTAEFCWIPLVGAVVGPVFVWISSWAMYAFGEHVENTQAIRNQITKINNIDRNLQTIAQPIIDEANGKAKREAEEKAKREAEEKAKREAEEKAKREAKKKTEQLVQKDEKTLSEKLEYALMFQTDDGMVRYLKGIQDETVQDILKFPQHLIREKIQNLLANM